MSFDFSTLVTDRSQEDLNAILNLLAVPMADWTAAQLAEFNRAVSKGVYNYADLNRVTACMDYLNEVLTEMGYETGYQRILVPHNEPEPEPIYVNITPVMTSNTTPAGYVASASSQIDATREAWHVFDGISDPGELIGKWHSGAGMPQWVMLQFPEAVSVARFFITNAQDDGTYHYTGITTFMLQGSNDGSKFDTLGEYTNQTGYGVTTTFDVKNPAPYMYYRIYITGSSFIWSNTTYAVIDEIKFYEDQTDYPEPMDPHTWYEPDIPTATQLSRYLQNVSTLRNTLSLPADTAPAPDDIIGLTQTEANNIERILLIIDLWIQNMARAWFYSGDLYAGEV